LLEAEQASTTASLQAAEAHWAQKPATSFTALPLDSFLLQEGTVPRKTRAKSAERVAE